MPTDTPDREVRKVLGLGQGNRERISAFWNLSPTPTSRKTVKGPLKMHTTKLDYEPPTVHDIPHPALHRNTNHPLTGIAAGLLTFGALVWVVADSKT